MFGCIVFDVFYNPFSSAEMKSLLLANQKKMLMSLVLMKENVTELC